MAYLKLKDHPEVARIVARAGGYKHATEAEVKAFQGPKTLRVGWSSGTREDYTLVNLETLESKVFDEMGAFAYGPFPAPVLETLPPGFALVYCVNSGGRAMRARVMVNADTLNRFALPEKPTLSWAEQAVLSIICGIKGGHRKQYFSQARITPMEEDAAKERLQALGLITKSGAITPAGRNSREWYADRIPARPAVQE